jgi:hypothetical protein
MSDRELLELAAKAAGHRIVEWAKDGNGVGVAIIFGGEGWGRERPWQPLLENQMTDADGDALRLAVKLGFFIRHSAHKPGETAYGFVGIAWYGQRVKFEPEKFIDDPQAATRRAITRAAAEIGKGMK